MAIVNTTHGTQLDGAQALALALGMYNAVNAQQQSAMVRQAATTMVCAAILSLGVAEAANASASSPSKGGATPASPTPPPAPKPVAAALASVAERVPPPAALAVDLGAAGMAYQSVAQSAALAVQDAADYLRSLTTIAATANGMALAQLLADPAFGAQYPAAVAAIEQLVAGAVAGFEAIGAAAENLLKNFPQG